VFKRRKKKPMEQKPKSTTTGYNIEKVEAKEEVKAVQKAVAENSIDAIVSKLMGLDKTKPFSTDRSLVNDMVALAREKEIKLPRFTADPLKIAKAIAEAVKNEEV
jgi:hypothetical protein